MINPLLLWFLPLAGLPVILHLITRLRLRTVELSTFRFLMDSYVQQRRRVRLLEWLVMLLRVAFIVLIIFTLSRPVVREFNLLGTEQGGRDVTIIIDASPTMALRSGATTSLQRAKAVARTIVDMLGREDHVRLIRAGGEPELLAEGFAGNTTRLLSRLEAMGTDAAAADLGEAIDAATAAQRHGSRFVYIISDGLAATWSTLEGHPALATVDDAVDLAVMDVGPMDPVTNVAVLGNPPQALRAVRGLPVLLSVTVANGSTDRPIDTTLSVVLDEQVVEQIPLNLQPGERATRSVYVTPAEAGVVRGRFEVPDDAFAHDNAFLFALNVQEKLRVALVSGPGGPRPVDRPQTYLKTALDSPLLAASGFSQTEQQVAAALEVRQVDHNRLDDDVLAEADVVVLADAPLDARRGAKLRRYVEAGGGLVVLPGEHVDVADYNAYLLGPTPAATLPKYGPPVGSVDDESQFATITRIRLAHPVLSGFADDHEARQYFSTVRLYRRLPIRLNGAGDDPARPSGADDARGVATLLGSDDRAPVLVDVPFGAGRMLLGGFPATPDWSNLPINREFVPMLIRSIAYLQRSPDVAGPSAVAPHQPAVVRITERWEEASVQAIDPTGKQHPVELHRDGARRLGAMLATDQPGYYQFQVSPNAKNAPAHVELGFAVNRQSQGGDFARAGQEKIRQWLAPLDVQYLAGDADDPLLTARLTRTREIWRMLIWITFAVIGAEFMLATLRPRAAAARMPSGPLAAAAGTPAGPVSDRASATAITGGQAGAGRFVERLRATLGGLGSAGASGASGSSGGNGASRTAGNTAPATSRSGGRS